MASQSTQLTPATALVQILTEHPELPAAEWSIGSVVPELRGFVYGGGMAELSAFAEVIGGSVQAANEYETQGQRLRRHVLTAVWRDVRVEVVVAVPASVKAVAA